MFTGPVVNLSISKAFLILFKKDGKIEIKENCYDTASKTFEVVPAINFESIESVPPPIIGMAEAKVNDVRSLLKFLSLEGRSFFENHFENVGIEENKLKSIDKDKIIKKEKKKKIPKRAYKQISRQTRKIQKKKK